MDIAIIGGGPAALGAALYAARSGLSVTVFEKKFVGGQISTTHAIDNYLGFDYSPSGPDLIAKMQEHVSKFDVKFKYSAVKELELIGDVKKIKTAKAEFTAKAVIIATGAAPRQLGIADEERFKGLGVSYCATCDGMFFKDKDVAVVGGGDTAVGDALYLAQLCRKVYIIHRRSEFRAAAIDVEKLRKLENVEFVTDSVVTALSGENVLSAAVLSTPNGERTINISGLFVAVGTVPETSLIKDVVTLDENGFVITDDEMQTNIKGVYAVGDIRKKPLRQVIMAVADGAVAATSAAKYISST